MVHDGAFSFLLFFFKNLCCSHLVTSPIWAGAQRDEINGNGGCVATKFPKPLRRDELPTTPFSSRHVNTSHVSDFMADAPVAVDKEWDKLKSLPAWDFKNVKT